MGNSHFRSDVYAKASTNVIRGFSTISATTLQGTTGTFTNITGTLTGNVTGNVTGSIDGDKIKCTSYIQLGSEQYLFFGSESTEASVLAAATALSMAGDAANATVIGSLYLSTAGYLWIFDSNTAATKLTRN